MIQYVVEEAVAAGLDRLGIVTGRASGDRGSLRRARWSWSSTSRSAEVGGARADRRRSPTSLRDYVRQKEPLVRARRSLRAPARRRRAVRGLPRRRHHRGGSAWPLSQLLACTSSTAPGARRRARAPRPALDVRAYQEARRRRQRAPRRRPGGEARAEAATLRPRHHRPLRADAQISSRSWARPRRPPGRDPAHRRPPAAPGAPTPLCGARFTGRRSTQARSSGSSRRPWRWPWRDRTWRRIPALHRHRAR